MATKDALDRLYELCQRGAVILNDDALDEFDEKYGVSRNQLYAAIDLDSRFIIEANIACEDDEPEYDDDGPPPVWKNWEPGLKHSGIKVRRKPA